MDNMKSQIRTYFLKEVTEIGKPNNPKQIYRFNNLEVLVDILFSLLDSQIQENTLQRVKDNFFNHTSKIIDFNIPELSNAIEGLATNFEPFLKLIAFLKYGNTSIWSPNESYSDGLKNTTLLNLYTAKINNKFNAPTELELQNIPEPLINYSGFQRTLLDFLRTDLRNAVHNAKLYSRMELLQYSNIVLACYLFVIQDNLIFLKQLYFPEYIYLKKIASDKSFENLDKVYVPLIAEEIVYDVDIYNKNSFDENAILLALENFDLSLESDDQSIDNLNEIRDIKRIDSILNIANDTKHFFLIGSPGSGKTTTLLKLLINNANQLLKGASDRYIPFLINAGEFRPDNTFLDILSKDFDKKWIESNLISGRFQILIDGLNEVSETNKKDAYDSIDFILSKYPLNSIIISDRKVNFEKRFDIKVFEIKDLNENQIGTFIQNYSSIHYRDIYNQIIENENILKFAYSPLTLKIILSVSKSGNVPQNRGLLYQVFINSILQREKTKKRQIEQETKLEMLSIIAFEMRNAGNVSISISSFKKLITNTIGRIGATYSFNLIFNELLDNLIIKTSHNENVAFFHETYQDYFCAVHLKYMFESTGYLEIAIDDKQWSEPLIICGEIIKDNSRAIDFFNLIFRGQIADRERKPLFDLNSSDYNKDIILACKVAFSLKSLRPDVYNLAKKYLSNYLILWKYSYCEDKIESFPLTTIFSAIASLNSKNLIHKVLCTYSWANIWLYSEKEENNSRYLPFVVDTEKQKETIALISAICLHMPNFEMFYDLANDAMNNFMFSPSIYKRLLYTKQSLLNSATVNSLKLYYIIKPDPQVYLSILKHDLSIINIHDFTTSDYKYNTRILKTLLYYHHTHYNAQRLITQEINTLNYSEEFSDHVIKVFYNKKMLDCLFEILEVMNEKKPDLFRNNILLLQSLPFSILSNNLQDIFLRHHNNSIIPFRNYNNDTLIIEKKYESSIIINEYYTVNNIFDIFIKKYFPLIVHGRQSIILRNDLIDEFTNISDKGFIKFPLPLGEIVLEYSRARIVSKKDKCEFYFDCELSDNLLSTNIIDIELIVNDMKGWRFVDWNFEEITDEKHIKVRFSIVASLNANYDIIDSGYLQLSYNNIDINKPEQYHPALISSNSKLMHNLRSKLDDDKTHAFISHLGISSYFHKELSEVHYGIITDHYENTLQIYSLKNTLFYEFSIFEDISKYSTERVVVIENDYRVSLINIRDEDLEKIGYIKSKIVHIDKERREGFILKRDCFGGNDYYFIFKSCNFSPEIGDSVKFLPSLNPSKRYKNHPIALKIYKIIPNKCRIIDLMYSKGLEYLSGKAIDIMTDEYLFFKIHTNRIPQIKNITNIISHNQVFEYSVIKKHSNDSINRIRLTTLVID